MPRCASEEYQELKSVQAHLQTIYHHQFESAAHAYRPLPADNSTSADIPTLERLIQGTIEQPIQLAIQVLTSLA
jgi:hypothetical protein